jgi:serine/threonine protein kinase
LEGISHKLDVYSYGMMVFEMAGGRRNIDVEIDRTSEILFPHWIYKRLEQDEDLGLQGLMNEEDHGSARKKIIVSLRCIQTNPSNRPPMSRSSCEYVGRESRILASTTQTLLVFAIKIARRLFNNNELFIV